MWLPFENSLCFLSPAHIRREKSLILNNAQKMRHLILDLIFLKGAEGENPHFELLLMEKMWKTFERARVNRKVYRKELPMK